MVTTDRPTNQVNLEQVCSLNIEQSRLLQFGTVHPESSKVVKMVGADRDHKILWWIVAKKSMVNITFTRSEDDIN